MEWLIAKSIADIGIALLSWLVQLIIYPSFLYVDTARFKGWHTMYTRNISFFVFPLMSSQVLINLFFVINEHSIIQIAGMFFILLAWINTFAFAVPLHGKLSGRYHETTILQLIRVNRWRTFFWSVVVLLDIWLLINVVN